MEWYLQVLVFALETLLVVIGIGAVILLIAAVVARSSSSRSDLEVERLDRHFKKLARRLKFFTLTDKDAKKDAKAAQKSDKKNEVKPTTFVLDFKGDIKASAVDCLREEISAVIGAASAGDDVVLRLESPGGMVHGYGLAASQLLRLKKANLKLTVCVDKVAASGGYMMACTSDRLLAAPFAIVGSIGVVAQVPNVHRLLKKHDVDYKEYTAGEFKRTVSLLGEITPKGEEKFLEQLEDTHVLFKRFVTENRPAVNTEKVGTGEHWYGAQAQALGLIDGISTSDELLMDLAKDRRLLNVRFHKKQKLNEKLSGFMGKAVENGFQRLLEELSTRRY